MNQFVPQILFVLAVAAFFLGPWVLSIWALARTRRLQSLALRVAELEERLGQPDLEAKPVVGERPAAGALAPSPQPVPGPSATATVRAAVESRSRLVLTKAAGIDWESFIGRKALGWGAMLLVVFSGGFFVKYAVENQWIGPLGRVMLAALAGAALVLGGNRARRRGWHLYFQMVTSAGVVLCYLAVYGAFGFYHLLPRQAASAFLLLIIAESAILAVLADAPALGLMAIAGGLITPLLLVSEKDDYVSFFSYLVALDVGAVLMVALRSWPGVGTVGLLGTQVLFWSWYAASYHPEKRAWALGFQGAVFALFLAEGLIAQARRRCEAAWEDIVRWLLRGGLGFTAFYVLLKPDYAPWMGVLALSAAALEAALARGMLADRPELNRLLLATLAMAVGFVAAAFPIQAEASWVALGWAAEAAALWWFGVRVQVPVHRVLAVVLLSLAVGRVLFFETSYGYRSPYWPVLNDHALPAIGVAACWLGALALTQRRMAKAARTEQSLAAAAEIGGVVLLWFILSVDLFGSFQARARFDPVADLDWERLGSMAVSVFWSVFAAIVLAVGFKVDRARLRWTALVLFGLVVLKVFLYDMADLDQIYRIAAFLAGAIVLGIAARVYQRLRPDPAETARGEVQANATN